MGTMLTTQFENITQNITQNIKLFTTAAYETWQREWKDIVEYDKAQLQTQKMLAYEGGGVLPQKTEGDASATSRIYEGNIERITQSTYSFDMPVSWEQRRFAVDNAHYANAMGMFQSRSANLRYEYTAAGVINNGYSTDAPYLGGDGKPYFSALHSWKSTGTYDNRLADADLNKTALENALKKCANARMEQNIPAAFKAKTIIIGYENIFVLPELLKSTLDPESANNTYNAFAEFALGRMLNHYLSDTDGYTLDTDQPTRILLEAQSPTLRSFVEGPSNTIVENIFTSIGAGFHHQAGSFGSQGG